MSLSLFTDNTSFVKTDIANHNKLHLKLHHPIRVKAQKIRINYIIRIAESHKMKTFIFFDLLKGKIPCGRHAFVLFMKNTNPLITIGIFI